MIWRVPARILSPTLFSDDGSEYFNYSYAHSWLEGLLKQHQGYYHLWANLLTVIAAKLVPLAYVPIIIICGGMMIGGLVIVLIHAPSSPFRSPLSRVTALLLLVLVPPYFSCASIAGSHFNLAICAMLILLSDARTRYERLGHRAILLLAGMSSPLVPALMPYYSWHYWRRRSPETLIHILIIAICSVIQGLALYHSHQFQNHQSGRFTGGDDIGTFIFWMTNRSVIHPLFGWHALERCGLMFEKAILAKDAGYWLLLCGCGIELIAWFALMAGLEKHAASHTVTMLAAIYGGMALFCFYTGYGHEKTEWLYDQHRYFALSKTAMVWIFLLHAVHSKNRYVQWGYSLLIAYMLFAGMYMWAFQTPQKLLNPVPKWKKEIALWKADPAHVIRIAPAGYSMRLKPYAP